MEFVIEKGTELGASAFLPFYCERSVGRRRRRREARALATPGAHRRAAVRPARRSRDSRTAEFDALLERFGDYDAVLFAWELAPPVPLRERLPRACRRAGRVLVVVGPEGGFTHDEAELAERRRGRTALARPRAFCAPIRPRIVLLAVIGALTS